MKQQKAEDSELVKRALALLHEKPAELRSDLPDNGISPLDLFGDVNVLAVKIYSSVLDDECWLILRQGFEPDNGVVYGADEFPLLIRKTAAQLREIHKVKKAFPGCRVIQEAAERKG